MKNQFSKRLLLALVLSGGLTLTTSGQTVTFNVSNVSVQNAISKFQRQTGYSFVFAADDVDMSRVVSVHGNKAKLTNVINQILDGQNVSYKVEGKRIVVKPQQQQERSTNNRSTPQKGNSKKIKGRIVDANSEPIVGATVVQKGTKNAAITDLDGNFVIDAPSNSTLTVSYVGFVDQDVKATDNVKVVLKEDQKALDEVVVIGYGSVKKSDLTGSVASVSGDDLIRTATNSPVAALQGRAAGVTVNLGSGSPDATASIQIRGVGTPNDSNPLYVVDGFPMSDINYLNPNDIKNIEILKDASATAIYGSRGANGVVIITTKSGQAGNVKIAVDAYYGFENIAADHDMLNSTQYQQLVNEAYKNAGEEEPYSSTPQYNTNWYKEAMHTGTTQSYNASLSGGSDKVQSLFSANYYKRNGVAKTTSFDRITLNQNNTFKPYKWLTFRSSLAASIIHNTALDATSIFMSSLIAPPNIPVIDPETGYYQGIHAMRLTNPVGAEARNNRKNKRNSIVANLSADINLTRDLVYTSRFGIKMYNRNDINYSPEFFETSDISNLVNTVNRYTQKSYDWTWENQLTYHHNWKDIHDLTVMAATSARKYKNDQYDASKENLPSDDINFWYFDAATDNPLVSGSGAELTMLSYLGRVNYSLLNRYLLTASIRADGSSRFTKDHRWGYFPSASLAWRISEEPFFKTLNASWWDNAKLRVGYGEIGNENIYSYYPYLTPISQAYYYTLGKSQTRINGATPSGIGNSDAQWETSKQFNVGIDLGFFDNRLTSTIDFYIRKTDNILLSQQIPEVSGFSSMIRNVGGMKNTGLEFTATWQDKVGDLKYSVSGNMAFVKNEVTDLGTSAALISNIPYDYTLIDLQGKLGNIIRSVVGKPYGQFWGYKTNGIFQNQSEIDNYKDAKGNVIMPDAKPGDMKFKDLDGDGKISTGDMTFIGNPIPKMTFGLTLNGEWKNFDVNLLFTGVAGRKIFNAAKYYFERFDGKQNVRADFIDNYWHGEGTSNKNPAISHNTTRNDLNFRASDWYVEDGSFVRLKTFQLGYTFHPKFTGVSPSIRVYFAAQNLFTITGYSGFDPEVNSDISVDRGQYPQPRTFMFGTNINF